MKTSSLLTAIVIAGVLSACASTVPVELANARDAYQRASVGNTARVAPAELHVASVALAQAEQSFKTAPDSFRTRDLAYVAWRKTQLADAAASIAIQQKSEAQAKNDFQTTQGTVVAKTKQDLSQTRSELAASQRTGEATAEKLSTEQKARADADQRAADAQAALAKLAAVKDEPRGTVITLSGSVLFASNRAVLLPEARTRLDQVTEVLLTNRERNLTVEGYTDSQGSASYNLDLSQRRADAVRSYLIERGYQGDLIQAHGHA